MLEKKIKVKHPKVIEQENKLEKETENVEIKKEKEVEKVVRPVELKRACGCCNKELQPLPHGQKYFEAPDGHVIVGEEKINQVWDRRGKGSWINPLR